MTPTALRVREYGAGTPLLLLHGLGRTGEAYGLLSPLLGETARIIVPDLRGHGLNAGLPGPYSPEMLAADLVPTLDALGVSSAHVLGHSYGGPVAQVFARAHPERVRSLILVTTYGKYGVTCWEWLLGWLAPPVVAVLGTRLLAWATYWSRSAGGGRRLSREAAAVRAATMAATERHHLIATLRLARQFDSRSWLGTLNVPTLVIAGDADLVVSSQQTQLLAEKIPGARLHHLDGAGHEVPLSHPADLAQLVSAWLDTIEQRTAATLRFQPSSVMAAAENDMLALRP